MLFFSRPNSSAQRKTNIFIFTAIFFQTYETERVNILFIRIINWLQRLWGRRGAKLYQPG